MRLLFDENLSHKLVQRLADLCQWTHPTRDAERVLRRKAIRMTEFAADPELGVLILDRD